MSKLKEVKVFLSSINCDENIILERIEERKKVEKCFKKKSDKIRLGINYEYGALFNKLYEIYKTDNGRLRFTLKTSKFYKEIANIIKLDSRTIKRYHLWYKTVELFPWMMEIGIEFRSMRDYFDDINYESVLIKAANDVQSKMSQSQQK
jgi:hypothetical protein